VLLVQIQLCRICVKGLISPEVRMKRLLSRRAIIARSLAAGAFIPLFGLTAPEARAAGLTPLDPADPTAKSLNFATASSKVDAKANPTYKPTQKCGNCAQYQGKPGDSSGGCNIFVGHSVPANGWCKVWVQKPAV
jgi:high potential iron-sulfur protein